MWFNVVEMQVFPGFESEVHKQIFIASLFSNSCYHLWLYEKGILKSLQMQKGVRLVLKFKIFTDLFERNE